MYIKVNNTTIHYEMYGKGKPLILLHGNGNNLKIFSKLIENLQNDYQIYALDSRCHGKSANSNDITYELMRDDCLEFIKKLNIKKPILYGFSDGGIIGLMIAVKEPNILSKLIVSGANLNPKGFKPIVLLSLKISYFFSKSKLVKLMIKYPSITPRELEKIKVPTIITAGTFDIVKKSHTLYIKDNIKNSVLEIIPFATHGSYVRNNKKLSLLLKKYL